MLTIFGNKHLEKPKGNSRLWQNWLVYCRLLDDIDFGCNFVNNRCKKYRSIPKKTTCCCGGCQSTKGYFNSANSARVQRFRGNKKALIEIKTAWEKNFENKQSSDSDGFWKDKIGCSLPRWARSAICQSHHCRFRKKNSKALTSILKYTRMEFNVFTNKLPPVEMIPVRKLRILAKKNNLLKKNTCLN